jgi:hypothetical protein
MRLNFVGELVEYGIAGDMKKFVGGLGNAVEEISILVQPQRDKVRPRKTLGTVNRYNPSPPLLF